MEYRAKNDDINTKCFASKQRKPHQVSNSLFGNWKNTNEMFLS